MLSDFAISLHVLGNGADKTARREARACWSHHVCTRAQSIARHFNFRTSDKASSQVGVTSEAVFFDPISSQDAGGMR